MKNKTILILSNDVDYLYTLRLETIERLLKDGFSVSLSAPSNDRVEFFEQLGCTFYPTEFTPRGKNPVSNLALLLKYVRLIKQVQPHVVLTYTIKANILKKYVFICFEVRTIKQSFSLNENRWLCRHYSFYNKAEKNCIN